MKALELWTRLDKSNMEFVEVLSRLVDDYTHDSDSYVKAADLAVQNAPLKVGTYPGGPSYLHNHLNSGIRQPRRI
jgi:hypothetical protein